MAPKSKSKKMDPYETDPAKIPPTDDYAHVLFHTPDVVLRYWESVVYEKCTYANVMYESEEYRDIFAVGSVIIKSNHMTHVPYHRDHSLSDANAPVAIALVHDCLAEMGIQVPTIYFQGKINNFDVLIESRISGVGLNAAWPSLSPEEEKASFKTQAREVGEDSNDNPIRHENPIAHDMSGLLRQLAAAEAQTITYREPALDLHRGDQQQPVAA
ncbi:hypothetical protein QBC33DRAFT_554252 [Phialemonium atrogriseum]|uniref:Uncharacterized protein n=1 Tax=Phialemonium atrogriseum TaxID=1093897 RepID=A0AAJ0C9V5_9PEZI|nr:uncharacterized protein QBC33DRAFT_554252 [Phialemonium atrogriseum]KAK1772809.1 hypothetical protein QBC33DRAFT_554252 [Phialemonium atrogriseum]